MKQLFFLFLLLCTISAFGQQQVKTAINYADLNSRLKSAKTLKKVGNIITGVGLASALVGVTLALSNMDFDSYSDGKALDLADKFGYIGLGLMAAGVPMILIGHFNEKKIKLALQQQAISIAPCKWGKIMQVGLVYNF